MLEKFCIYGRGGLGDTIKRYFGYGDGWEYLEPFKARFPDCEIKYVALSANPFAADFYKPHPLIDSVQQGAWSHPQRPCTIIHHYKNDHKLLMNSNKIKTLKPKVQDRVYLTNEDEAIVNAISSDGPYVVLHPFSSTKMRMVMPVEEYYPLVDRIKRDGFKVVVVGANWIKSKSHEPQKEMKDEFYHDAINLIDKANPRAVVGLILKAACLIAVRSFCFSTTISGKVKSILLVSSPKSMNRKYFTPKQNHQNLLESGWDKRTVNRNIGVVGVDNHDFKKARDQIAGHLKNMIS